ncbi:hypothetical protein [Roseinatronobacter sp. NSM]|uniref:hypothetical protein n=1 Tax=Roseinatronobacter sp. NSM TaxID=3457785 RepID=UPI0040352159
MGSGLDCPAPPRCARHQTLFILARLSGLLVLTFVMGRIVPTDPVRAIVGQDATREVYEHVFRQLGLDRPDRADIWHS